jgi:hypothetical protein
MNINARLVKIYKVTDKQYSGNLLLNACVTDHVLVCGMINE